MASTEKILYQEMLIGALLVKRMTKAESQAFLTITFKWSTGFNVYGLAQFNSFYNSFLVLLAVIMSTTGVLIGMLVMDQTFSLNDRNW